MPGFDDDNFGLDFDAPTPKKTKPRKARVVEEPDDDNFGLDFDAPTPAVAKEAPNAPGVPTDEPRKPMGPPPPPQVEAKNLRQPTEPSLIGELGRSASSFVGGASANLMDELLGAGNYLGGKVGLRPEVSWDEAHGEAEATVRPMTRDYPAAQMAGQAALGMATAPLGGASVAGQAVLGGAVAAGSEYADSRDPWRTALAGTLGAGAGALGTWGGNKLAARYGLTPTEVTKRDLAEAAAQARFHRAPQPEPLGPMPVAEGTPRPAQLPSYDVPYPPPPPAPVPEPGLPFRPTERPPPPAYPPETPLYGPFAEGPRPLDLPEQAAVPYRPEPAPPVETLRPPPHIPPGPARDPFHGRAGELARMSPEAPPTPPTPPTPPPPVMDELIRAPAPAIPAKALEKLTPQERLITETVLKVLPSLPREKNGGVFIGRLLDAFPEELREPVKAALPQLQQSGALKMMRADLVQAFDPEMIARSTIRRGTAPQPGGTDTRAAFHFIDAEAHGLKPTPKAAPGASAANEPHLPPAPAAAPAGDDLESLLRQSLAKGKPPPAAPKARPQPPARAQMAPPEPPPAPVEPPLELGASVPPRPQPKWMEPPPAPEWTLEPIGAPGAGPRQATPPLDVNLGPDYKLGALESGVEDALQSGARARAPSPFAEAPYGIGDVESGALLAARHGASPPRANAPGAWWERPAPYEVGNPDLTPGPEQAGGWPKKWAAQMEREQIGLERAKAQAQAPGIGEKVADKFMQGVGWLPGTTGRVARIGRAGLQAAQAARTAPGEQVKLAANTRARQAVQNIAYAGAPTLNYAVKSALGDARNGLSPEDQGRLNSAVLSGDQQATNAIDYALSQTNAAYARVREEALRATSTEEE